MSSVPSRVLILGPFISRGCLSTYWGWGGHGVTLLASKQPGKRFALPELQVRDIGAKPGLCKTRKEDETEGGQPHPQATDVSRQVRSSGDTLLASSLNLTPGTHPCTCHPPLEYSLYVMCSCRFLCVLPESLKESLMHPCITRECLRTPIVLAFSYMAASYTPFPLTYTKAP